MRNNTLNDFIRQVRKNNRDILFPLLNEQRFQAIYFRPYNLQSTEVNGLVSAMEEELSALSLIQEISDVMEHEDIPENKKLADYIQNVHKIFSAYAMEGHYAGRYFTKLLSFLEGFLSFVRLNNQRDDELMTKIQSLLSGKIESGSRKFSVEDISFYLDCKTRGVEKLNEYHDIFNEFLQEESDKRQGLKVITRTEQWLLTLIDTIQQSIFYSESSMKLLGIFQKQLLLAEKQEQNN